MDRNEDWNVVEKDEFYANHDYSTCICLEKTHLSEEVHINLWSKYLRTLYRDTAGRHLFEGVDIQSTSIRIRPPYCPLFHCLDEMEAAIKNDPDVAAWEKANFEALRRYCTEGRVGQAFESIRDDLASNIVACDELWALYKPDEQVVVTDSGPGNQLCVMRIVSVLRTTPLSFADQRKPMGWDVNCAQLAWDGSNFRFQIELVKIAYYPGTKALTDLTIIPLRLHPDQERIKKSAQVRGKKWSQFCTGKPKAMLYEGFATPMAWARDDGSSKKPELIEVRGELLL
jgi:hypothetical protein